MKTTKMVTRSTKGLFVLLAAAAVLAAFAVPTAFAAPGDFRLMSAESADLEAVVHAAQHVELDEHADEPAAINLIIEAQGLVPPADNPPDENPPADNPPDENPPTDNPPDENPPADNPPSLEESDTPTPDTDSDDSTLPFTGGNGTPFAVAGLLIALAGAVVFIYKRRVFDH